jgi:hypothetical protein
VTRPTALRVLHGDTPSRINRAEPRDAPPEKPATLTPKRGSDRLLS